MIENKKLTGCGAEKLLEGVGLKHWGVLVGIATDASEESGGLG